MKSKTAQRKKYIIIFFTFLVCLLILFLYSYFSYPKIVGNGVGVSANTPFLQQPEKIDTVNINTAPIEELMILPGIGETKALAIIEYREVNNGFSSIEEIMNVSGIGEKTYKNLKMMITI